MTPAQIIAIKTRLGLTWAQLAREIGVTERAVKGFAAGEYKPSRPVVMLLERLQ